MDPVVSADTRALLVAVIIAAATIALILYAPFFAPVWG